MEVWIFAGLMGMWFCVLFLITGILIGRGVRNDNGNDKRTTERTDGVDSDIHIYVPSRNRTRSSNNGYDQSVEEVIDVLNTFRVGASRREKAALDYCMDKIRNEEIMDVELIVKYRFYKNNKDFKAYVDKCAKTYNKTVDQMLQSPITEEYYLLLLEKEKSNKDEN